MGNVPLQSTWDFRFAYWYSIPSISIRMTRPWTKQLKLTSELSLSTSWVRNNFLWLLKQSWEPALGKYRSLEMGEWNRLSSHRCKRGQRGRYGTSGRGVGSILPRRAAAWDEEDQLGRQNFGWSTYLTKLCALIEEAGKNSLMSSWLLVSSATSSRSSKKRS